jgi:hypothetical protein
MPKKKSPFRNYEVEDILEAEAYYFTLQVGNDLYDHNGTITFNKQGVIRHYNKVLRELTILSLEGSAKERKKARDLLATLKVSPLRIN